MKNRRQVPILIADDDTEDLDMIRDALKESRLLNEIKCVKDGEELMDYLLHRAQFENSDEFPLPGLILLDLNMPKKDGREALAEIKSHPKLRQIPVVVFTTSKAEEDVYRTYDLGVNSFITKPVSFEALVTVIKALGQYWFEIVELPNTDHSDK
jgi:CheY-like chemotaxis protein